MQSESSADDEEAEPPAPFVEPTPPNVTAEGLAVIDAKHAERLAKMQAELLSKANAETRRRISEAKAHEVVKAKEQAEVSRSSNYVGQAQTYTATAYTAYCEGCSGITKTGVDLRKSIYSGGYKVIAVDPRYIPLGSIVRVTLGNGNSFEAIAEDIGGAIQGAIIDVAHETKAQAYEFGRQSVEVRVVRRGR